MRLSSKNSKDSVCRPLLLIDVCFFVFLTAVGLVLFKSKILLFTPDKPSFLIQFLPFPLVWGIGIVIISCASSKSCRIALFSQPGILAVASVYCIPFLFALIEVKCLSNAGGEFEGAGFVFWLPTIFHDIMPILGSGACSVYLFAIVQNILRTPLDIRVNNWINRFATLLTFYWVALSIEVLCD